VVTAIGRDGRDQAVQCFRFFLQFLDKTLDCTSAELKIIQDRFQVGFRAAELQLERLKIKSRVKKSEK